MILVEDAIVTDEAQVLHLCLSNQHSVEGIAVLSRKPARPDRVIERYRQRIASQLGEVAIKLVHEFFARRQFA